MYLIRVLTNEKQRNALSIQINASVLKRMDYRSSVVTVTSSHVFCTEHRYGCRKQWYQHCLYVSMLNINNRFRSRPRKNIRCLWKGQGTCFLVSDNMLARLATLEWMLLAAVYLRWSPHDSENRNGIWQIIRLVFSSIYVLWYLSTGPWVNSSVIFCC